jgi:hypothetical protein
VTIAVPITAADVERVRDFVMARVDEAAAAHDGTEPAIDALGIAIRTASAGVTGLVQLSPDASITQTAGHLGTASTGWDVLVGIARVYPEHPDYPPIADFDIAALLRQAQAPRGEPAWPRAV